MKTQTPGTSTQDLIHEAQPLVRSLAMRVHRSIPVRVDLDDLVAYGELGLAEAARDFDPEAGARFTTFAYYRVRGAIYDGLAKMSWTSRAQYRRLRYQQMASEVLSDESRDAGQGYDTTLAEDASWFGRVAEKLTVVHLASEQADSEQPGLDFDDGGPTASAIVAHLEISQRLRELIDQLPRQQQRLIRLVYFEGFNLKEAADRIGISKSWASRLHAQALAHLARSLRCLGAHD